MQLFKHKASYGYGRYTSPYLLEVAHSGTFSSQVATGTLTANAPGNQVVSCARALSAYCMGNDGLLHLLGTNTVRVEPQGLLVEGGSTNLALWSRDLTNVTWTKTNCTAALTATGVDGAANSASVLTATGAAATCNQTITSASATRNLAIYLRRNVGSGTVSIAVDGTTYTDVTAQLSASFVRVSINQAAVTNPVLSIKLATSGDAVDVDLVQCENLGFASSPIPTTTLAVTRPADVVTVANPLSGTGQFRAGARVQSLGSTIQSTQGANHMALVGDGWTAANTWTLRIDSGPGSFFRVWDSGVGQKDNSFTFADANTVALTAFTLNAGAAPTMTLNGANQSVTTAGAGTNIVSAQQATLTLGSRSGGDSLFGWLTNVFVDNK